MILSQKLKKMRHENAFSNAVFMGLILPLRRKTEAGCQ
jgi:hypothetical protein